jgi:hypothetical protein
VRTIGRCSLGLVTATAWIVVLGTGCKDGGGVSPGQGGIGGTENSAGTSGGAGTGSAGRMSGGAGGAASSLGGNAGAGAGIGGAAGSRGGGGGNGGAAGPGGAGTSGTGGGGAGGTASPRPCAAKALAVGSSHACALTTAGGVRCWGGGAPTVLASWQSGPAGIVVDATSVYWVNQGVYMGVDGAVMKVPLGGGATTTLAASQGGPLAIAVDTSSVYWTNGCTSDWNGDTDGI